MDNNNKSSDNKNKEKSGKSLIEDNTIEIKDNSKNLLKQKSISPEIDELKKFNNNPESERVVVYQIPLNNNNKEISNNEGQKTQSDKNKSGELKRPKTNSIHSKGYNINNVNSIKQAKEKCSKFLGKYIKEFFVEGFDGMAQGLFCTLIAGTIICQIGRWCGKEKNFGKFLFNIGILAKNIMGAGIGIGLASKYKSNTLITFSSIPCGIIGAYSKVIMKTLIENKRFDVDFNEQDSFGNPIGSFICAALSIKIAELYAGKTGLDIILIPCGMIFLSIVNIFIAWPFIKIIELIGNLIDKAIDQGTEVKYIVCIFISIIMGIFSTIPITSTAAIWIAIGADENNNVPFQISSAAACCGCAAHNIGFSAASFRENKWRGLISQGFGTSMIQMLNVMKKPIILIPPVVSSIVVAILSVAFDLRCNTEGGGMGTSGLVGLFGIIDVSEDEISTWRYVIGIILCLFIVPAGVSLLLSEFMRNKGWIKYGDMKLENL